MSARDWGYAPGDSGYDYHDDDPERIWASTAHTADDEDDDPSPRQNCYLDGYGKCVDFEQCRYFGCYHRGMWRYRSDDTNDDTDPQF